jgi:hypothetical protein
MLLRNMHGSSV